MTLLIVLNHEISALMPKDLKKRVWALVLIGIGILAFYGINKRKELIANAQLTEGIIIEKGKRAKGQAYVAYRFFVDNNEYRNSVSIEFCNECEKKCCEIGAKVKVRYQKDNPTNSDLIH